MLVGTMSVSVQPTTSAPFVVVKGYHMGSKWFEESFNRLPGCGFMFEYEHCLRAMGRKLQNPHDKLAPPTATMHFLRHGCQCPESCAPNPTCHGSNSSRPLLDSESGIGSSGVSGGISSGSRIGEQGHRARERKQLSASTASVRSYSSRAPCRAVGVSFGALGPAYIAHLQSLLTLSRPRAVAVVVHIRTNHVKHALSFLRTSCSGEANHITRSAAALTKHSARLYVPPALLALRAWIAARAMDKILEDADAVRGESPLAYVLRYEAMQRDIGGEMAALLRAVGAPPAPLYQPPAVSLVKASVEDVGEMLVNAPAVEAAFRSLPCLHAMLVARGPVDFGLRTCEKELATLPTSWRAAMEQERLNRTHVKVGLHPQECLGVATTRLSR